MAEIAIRGGQWWSCSLGHGARFLLVVPTCARLWIRGQEPLHAREFRLELSFLAEGRPLVDLPSEVSRLVFELSAAGEHPLPAGVVAVPLWSAAPRKPRHQFEALWIVAATLRVWLHLCTLSGSAAFAYGSEGAGPPRLVALLSSAILHRSGLA